MNESFSSFLHARLKERGLTLKKLSELSGISVKHIEALGYGDFGTLPPPPYVHGYIMKLGSVLGFDAEEWWRAIQEEQFMGNAGPTDRPPLNRFSGPKAMRLLWTGLIVIFIVLYGTFQLPRIFGKPTLKLAYPAANPFVSATSSLTLRGVISGGWNELTLNGENIPANSDGSWEKMVLLDPGLNTFAIHARKFLGGEANISEEIVFEQPATSTTSQ